VTVRRNRNRRDWRKHRDGIAEYGPENWFGPRKPPRTGHHGEGWGSATPPFDWPIRPSVRERHRLERRAYSAAAAAARPKVIHNEARIA
jgi:hypothetical protein